MDSNLKYLIFGGGWLGKRLCNYLGEYSQINKNDITRSPLESYDSKFNIWINTAAKTKIDWCEKNKWETFQINTIAAIKLAILAYQMKKKYVFLSSACVFQSNDKNDIKDEFSKPNPQCFYALSKWMAEELIIEQNPNALIVRMRLPISEFPHERNTLNKLLNYSKLNTNEETITIIEDMLPVLVKLIKEDAKGIYHLVNGGIISPAHMGELLNYPHEKITKQEQDEMLRKRGQAQRVTAYITSTKIPPLKDLWEDDHIIRLIHQYNEHKEK